jgi:prepilin-type processing-associated H-X9-DG protein
MRPEYGHRLRPLSLAAKSERWQPVQIIGRLPNKCRVTLTFQDFLGKAGKLSQLRPSSQIVVVFEKRTSVAEVSPDDDAYYASVGGAANQILGSPVGRMRGDWRRFSTRHNHGGNILFADGHVEWFRLRDVLTPSVNGTNWNKPGERIWNITGPAH